MDLTRPLHISYCRNYQYYLYQVATGSTISKSLLPFSSTLAPFPSPHSSYFILDHHTTSLYPLAVLVLLHRCVAGLTCRIYMPARKTGVRTYLRPRGLNYHRESPYVATLLLNLPNCIGTFFLHGVSRKRDSLL